MKIPSIFSRKKFKHFEKELVVFIFFFNRDRIDCNWNKFIDKYCKDTQPTGFLYQSNFTSSMDGIYNF